MSKTLISSGSAFEKLAGYSRAVLVSEAAGDTIYVSGTTGFDYAAMTIADGVVEQTEQCFRNISHALGQAGASLSDVVRVIIYLVDRADFERVAPIVGRHLADVRPANTTVVSGLVDARMKIEIEVTARRVTPSATGIAGPNAGP
jgi:enamine deaminase RidA (YjgF/YER057c/UK114 family)